MGFSAHWRAQLHEYLDRITEHTMFHEVVDLSHMWLKKGYSLNHVYLHDASTSLPRLSQVSRALENEFGPKKYGSRCCNLQSRGVSLSHDQSEQMPSLESYQELEDN